MKKYILPAVMICLNLGQAVVMLTEHKPVNMIYWLAAAMLNASVAIMGK